MVDIPHVSTLLKQKSLSSRKPTSAYDDVLTEMVRQIVQVNTSSPLTLLSFKVPVVHLEYHDYNLHDCVIHIAQKLIEKGYNVNFSYPDTVIVDWSEIVQSEVSVIAADIEKAARKLAKKLENKSGKSNISNINYHVC